MPAGTHKQTSPAGLELQTFPQTRRGQRVSGIGEKLNVLICACIATSPLADPAVQWCGCWGEPTAAEVSEAHAVMVAAAARNNLTRPPAPPETHQE